jgi:hypothetical protein
MISIDKKELVLTALDECRRGHCDDCPLQATICDTLYVETEVIPTELLDLIEELLSCDK